MSFLARGKADLKACKMVDAQLSAYLAQQAIEKHAKALILKCGISNKPIQLGHFVLRSMIAELANRQERLRCKTAKGELPIEQLKPVWDFIDGQLKKAEKEPVLRIVFKDSLGMDYSDEERKIRDEYGVGFNVSSNPDIFRLLKICRDIVLSEILKVRKRPTSFVDSDKAQCFAILAIMIASPSIVNLFPHETYGRYPNAVGDKRAAQVYESHPEGLKELIAGAAEDCRFLEKVVLAMPDMAQPHGSERAG